MFYLAKAQSPQSLMFYVGLNNSVTIAEKPFKGNGLFICFRNLLRSPSPGARPFALPAF